MADKYVRKIAYSVALDREMLDSLDRIAETLGLGRAELIRAVINAYLASDTKEITVGRISDGAGQR